MPFPRHHIHTGLAAAVCGNIIILPIEVARWPALGGVSVHGKGHVFCPRKSGSSGSDEEEARVGGLEEQGDEGRGHNLRPNSVDVPGLVPYLALCHSSSGELLVDLRTFYEPYLLAKGLLITRDKRTGVVDQRIESFKFKLNFVERFLDRVIMLDIDLE